MGTTRTANKKISRKSIFCTAILFNGIIGAHLRDYRSCNDIMFASEGDPSAKPLYCLVHTSSLIRPVFLFVCGIHLMRYFCGRIDGEKADN